MVGTRGIGRGGRGARSGATPEINNPSLPPIRTNQSFGYGAEQTPALSRQFNVNPDMSVSDMASNIAGGSRNLRESEFDKIIKTAQTTPHRGRATRSHQRELSAVTEDIPDVPSVPLALKPSGRSQQQKGPSRRRQKTPDQEQLEHELRRASEEAEETPQSGSQQRTAPNAFQMPVPERPSTGSSHVDTATERSWMTERHTVPRHLPQPHKIAPQQQPLPIPQFASQNVRSNGVQKPVPQKLSLPANRTLARSSPSSWGFSDSPSGDEHARRGPTRTAGGNPSFEEPVHPSVKEGFPQSQNAMLIIIVASSIWLIMSLIGGLCALGGAPGGILPFKLPFSRCNLPVAGHWGNKSDCDDAINEFSDRLSHKVDDMDYRVGLIREDLEMQIAAVVPRNPLVPQRVNFFNQATGAVIIPTLTTPTKAPAGEAHFWSRFAKRVSGIEKPQMSQFSPRIALDPWEEMGECWCAPGDDIQLGVSLGYYLIPEEIVVEHISKDATLGPGFTPRDMELWAEYVPIGEVDEAPQIRLAPSLQAEYHHATTTPKPQPPRVELMSPYYLDKGRAPISQSARLYLLDTMRLSYKGEPDSAFADDPKLGPTFFRIGKWDYNIYDHQTTQRFRLNVVVELPGYRVKNVVVRVKSNYGAPTTCLYRVRLYGTPMLDE